jgi:hypothetical protein
VLAAVTLSACGGSSSPNSKTASKTVSDRASTMLALARCIRANGVPNFPDPTGHGGGIQATRTPNGEMSVNGVAVNAPAFQAAMRKCNSKMPQGPPVTAAELANVRAGALKMATCMRKHGVTDFPDPVVKAGPGGHGIMMSVGAGSGGPNPQSPAFEAAQSACGAGGGFPGSSGSTGTAKSTASGSR